MAEATRRGLRVSGHVPGDVSPVEAAEAGMHSIEHLRAELGGYCTRATEVVVPRLSRIPGQRHLAGTHPCGPPRARLPGRPRMGVRPEAGRRAAYAARSRGLPHGVGASSRKASGLPDHARGVRRRTLACRAPAPERPSACWLGRMRAPTSASTATACTTNSLSSSRPVCRRWRPCEPRRRAPRFSGGSHAWGRPSPAPTRIWQFVDYDPLADTAAALASTP